MKRRPNEPVNLFLFLCKLITSFRRALGCNPTKRLSRTRFDLFVLLFLSLSRFKFRVSSRLTAGALSSLSSRSSLSFFVPKFDLPQASHAPEWDRVSAGVTSRSFSVIAAGDILLSRRELLSGRENVCLFSNKGIARQERLLASTGRGRARRFFSRAFSLAHSRTATTGLFVSFERVQLL